MKVYCNKKDLQTKSTKQSPPPSSDSIRNRSTASAPGTPPKACVISITGTMQAGDHPKQPIEPSAWCRSHHRSSQCHASSISAISWFESTIFGIFYMLLFKKKMQSISDIYLTATLIRPNWWKFFRWVLQPRLQQLQIITTQLFWWMNRLRPWKKPKATRQEWQKVGCNIQLDVLDLISESFFFDSFIVHVYIYIYLLGKSLQNQSKSATDWDRHWLGFPDFVSSVRAISERYQP